MNNEFLAVAIVTVTVFAVLWLNRQDTKWVQTILDWFPAILFAYVIPASFTHLFGLDLSTVFLHELSRDWIIPFAILTVMGALPFAQLKIVGARPIILFVGGSLVIAVLPVSLVYLFGIVDQDHNTLFIGQEYWKGLVPIVGGWIGGSTSQLVLKELIQTEEALFLSILVLDNILVNIWTILMFQFIKRSDYFNHIFKIDSVFPTIDQDATDHQAPLSAGISVVIIAGIIVVTYFTVDSFLWKVIALSVIGLLLGNLIKRWNTKLVLRLGSIAIVLIMAILGLRLDFNNLSLPVVLVVLVVIWLFLHFAFMLMLAVILRVNIAWVPIASMANLGGISTAPAVTSAYKKELMPHAILLAILSMMGGTSWGMFTIFLFERLSQ